MEVIFRLRGKPKQCSTTHHFECPCIFGYKYNNFRQIYFDIMAKWQAVVEEVSNLSEFSIREDFTVINQPFLKHVVSLHYKNMLELWFHCNSNWTYEFLNKRDCWRQRDIGCSEIVTFLLFFVYTTSTFLCTYVYFIVVLSPHQISIIYHLVRTR